jgi:hypothetical protein
MRLAIQQHSLDSFTLHAAETAQDSFRSPWLINILKFKIKTIHPGFNPGEW